MSELQRLDERMTYDQLFRISDPKRVARSFKVRGPPLDIDSYQDAVYYIFNFKANPSTTGLRHKGYVKFYKPRNPRRTPLQKLECLVDCTCPDFRYRWAWANKQRGSGVVGPKSLNQALNRAPKKTNPQGKPGLCKHVLAAREYIYGLLSSFPGDEPDTAEKLNKLTKYATKRWANFPQLMRQAKEREAEIKRRIAMRNLGRPVTPDELERVKVQPPPPAAPAKPVKPAAPTKAAAPPKPGQPPSKLPPKGKVPEVPPAPVPSTKTVSRPPATKGTIPTVPPAPVAREQSKAAPKKPKGQQGPYSWFRPESKVARTQRALHESVVKANAELMITLQEARKLVREMEDDALSFAGPTEAPPTDMPGADTAEPLEPMEPPISDTAIGADTESDTALGLLRQMTDLLTQLVTALAPEAGPEGEMGLEGGMPPGAEGGMPPGAEGGMPGEGGPEGEMPPEPPVDMPPGEEGEGDSAEHEASESPGEEKAEHEEGGEEDEEKEVEETRAPRNRRPVA